MIVYSMPSQSLLPSSFKSKESLMSVCKPRMEVSFIVIILLLPIYIFLYMNALNFLPFQSIVYYTSTHLSCPPQTNFDNLTTCCYWFACYFLNQSECRNFNYLTTVCSLKKQQRYFGLNLHLYVYIYYLNTQSEGLTLNNRLFNIDMKSVFTSHVSKHMNILFYI